MKKQTLLTLLMALMAVNSAFSREKELGGDDNAIYDKLKQTTLVAVLTEENVKYTDKLAKKGKIDDLNQYRKAIKKYNDEVQKVAVKCLNIGSGNVVFKSMSDIIKMSADERSKCSFMVYCIGYKIIRGAPNPNYSMNSSSPINRQFDMAPGERSPVRIDFYSEKQNDLDNMLSDYADFMDFNCLTADYDGPLYCTLTVFVKGNDKLTTGKDSWLRPGNYNQIVAFIRLKSVVPQESELAYAFRNFRNQIDSNIAWNGSNVKMKDLQKRAMAQLKGGVEMAKRRTLLINKNNLADGVTEENIKAVYPYSFKMVDDSVIENAIYNKDSNVCVFLLYDTHGNNAFFAHAVVDPYAAYAATYDAIRGNMEGWVEKKGASDYGWYKVKADAFKQLMDAMNSYEK